jgi:molybdate transport system substrate-binding protein
MGSLQSTTRSALLATHRALFFVFVGLFLFACGCGKPAAPPQQELVVLAAASLKESFTEIATDFEKAHPGVRVTLSFAGSQQLAQSIKAGAPADVFASADENQMSEASKSGRIEKKSIRPFARNTLVVVANPKSKVSQYSDLSKPGVKVVLADKTVPAGKYALQLIDQMGSKGALLKNVVSYEENVRSVLTKVELGEADAGIVYMTDALAAGDKVSTIHVEWKVKRDATYFIAALTGPQSRVAQQFVDDVMSTEGQAVLRKHGFLPGMAEAKGTR